MKEINTKSYWKKLSLLKKLAICLLILSLISLILGVVGLATINYGIFTGFYLIRTNGIINTLNMPLSEHVLPLVFIKISTIFAFFIMPITIFMAAVLLLINKLLF